STDVLDWQSFFTVGTLITLIIGAVVLVNWINFARGGKQIAAALGGRLVQPGADDPLEQRAANIVQEMALAANMPVPSLFVLDEEPGINAFAAGTSPANAVVAVTRGALTSLNRDQLQGVIGHEFSHILNGDMRLSIRLAAMLRGITFIGDVGSILLHSASHRRRYRSSKKDDGRGAVLAIGLGLYLIGLLGGLMAGLIKSAISKQKEYLADASAVQFTRNPEGIGDALKIIGGYGPGTFVETARAEEMSHLFFGQVRHRLWSGFATHPPIEKRIERIDPQWDGEFMAIAAPQPASLQDAEDDPGDLAAVAAIGATLAVAGSLQPDASEGVGGRDEDKLLLKETKDSLCAMALVLGMVWDPQHEQTQWRALSEVEIKGLAETTQRWCKTLRERSAAQRLHLLELCLPTLRGISVPQYQTFRELLLTWISADGKTDLSEWCLFQMVRHTLDATLLDTRPARPRHKSLTAVTRELATALGTLAHLTEENTEHAFDRGRNLLELPLTLPETPSLTVAEFGKAVDALAGCYPLLKVQALKAMAAVAADDGEISDLEITLVKAMAVVMDCPVPDVMLEAHGIKLSTTNG
ncbi:MAG: M48 family metallopeptidase, partial [Gammaproteobacteria bacterium]|nr:M48 family metallopeptidase [Gammaproteobacteria bacterium]